jgi:hypothetical protein
LHSAYVFSVCNLEGKKTRKRVSSRAALDRDRDQGGALTSQLQVRSHK